jgi:hypothetical protein
MLQVKGLGLQEAEAGRKEGGVDGGDFVAVRGEGAFQASQQGAPGPGRVEIL